VAMEKPVCYIGAMASTAKQLLERVASWPEEDQQELAEVAREIEARRSGIYDPTPEEEAAIREGIAQLDRGEWVESAAAFDESSLQSARDRRPRSNLPTISPSGVLEAPPT